MSNFPLSVVGVGMISCLGEGAEINAAAMRCEYDGFQQTEFTQPFTQAIQIGAPIETDLSGIKKLSYMSTVVVKQAIAKLPKNYQGLTVLYCMPDNTIETFFNTNAALREIIAETFKKLPLGTLSKASNVFWQQRYGFISALKQAQKLIHQNKHEFVLIVTLDSLLSNAILRKYGGELNAENCRLLCEENSNGFIPGEAATAILLSSPTIADSEIIISGVGEGVENAAIDNEENVLTGSGLANAINQASNDAGVDIHKTHFRVSSVSGEDYFFKEAALAQIKTLKQKVSEQPLWHPADNVGEVGAAIGGVIVIMAYYAFIKQYAPGNSALCQISNDNSLRGAFIMQYKPSKNFENEK